MGLGSKNRQTVTAQRCREHLRARHRAQAMLVEEFIREIEGAEQDGLAPDPGRWQIFNDPSHRMELMLQRVEEHFEQWLRGEG